MQRSSCAQAVQLINREKAVVIDVCGADEFAKGHIAGAKNIKAEDFESKLPAAVKNSMSHRARALQNAIQEGII